MAKSTSSSSESTSSAAQPAEAARPSPTPVDKAHALALFQELLRELRSARQREDFVTFGFASLMVLVIARPILEAGGGGPGLMARAVAAAGIALLGWRVNGFLAANRNRQNQCRKVITLTERSYPFPTDRAYVRLSDLKNLDDPGEWDKSDYSLADWDRSEYGMFLKLLLLVAIVAVLAF